MKMTRNIDEKPTFNSFVKNIGGAVTPDEVDTYGRLLEIEDSSYINRIYISAWEEQQNQERAMRNSYAKWLLIAVFVQAILINIAFFFIGFSVIIVEQWVATAFIIGVFAEITAMTTIVVRHFFPSQKLRGITGAPSPKQNATELEVDNGDRSP